MASEPLASAVEAGVDRAADQMRFVLQDPDRRLIKAEVLAVVSPLLEAAESRAERQRERAEEAEAACEAVTDERIRRLARTDRLQQAVDATTEALQQIVAQVGGGCENFYGVAPGACWRAGRTPDAEYAADRCCPSCIAERALAAVLGESDRLSPESEDSSRILNLDAEPEPPTEKP